MGCLSRPKTFLLELGNGLCGFRGGGGWGLESLQKENVYTFFPVV